MTIRDYKSLKMINFNNRKKVDIESVIKHRLTLQTNIRKLNDEYGVDPSYILSLAFIRGCYVKWPEEKRERFLILIGGEVNLNKTKDFYHGKLAKTSNEI